MASQNQKVASPKNNTKPVKVSGRKAPKTAKVVSKIKAAGLNKLIGKISKRAAKNAKFVKAKGKTPDKTSGRALASVGSVGSANAKNSAKSYKLDKVATEGKAGGSQSWKGVGGLAVGNVGNATVGILEEETEVQGGLDRSVIARVIESHLGQIRYCYERQLSANPGLYGKVQVRFAISSNGSVQTQNVGRTTLNSAMVEGCILRRVAGWRFPKPKGGTRVLVTYPFLFKSTN